MLLLIGRLVLLIGTHPLSDFTGPAGLKADALGAAAGLPVFALISDFFADLFGAAPV